MSDLISEVMSIRTFLEREKASIRYDECNESMYWTLCKDRIYRIPGYQREIQWGKNNAQILLRDLSVGRKYLGNILISTSDKKEYQIIDGQQRLTIMLMLLKKLENIKKEEMCEFINDTFPMFHEAMDNSFLFDGEKEKEYILSDYLNQRYAMKELWDTVSEFVDNMSDSDKSNLCNYALDSRICVLISKVDKGINESRRVCVDYFIDINNKSKELEYTDILKAYAFREEFDEASDKWINILKNINILMETEGAIYYPKEALFYHYLICQVNKQFDYKSIRISEDYKLRKEFFYEDKRFSKGTDIEILIDKPGFYRNMLSQIIDFQQFMKLIQNDKTSPSKEFCDFMECEELIKYDLKNNAFIIISSILKNTDVVPKLLVMKYYLEVLNSEHKSKSMLETIYWINILAVFFSAAKTSRKSTDAFASLIMRKDWIDAIKLTAEKQLDAFPMKIGFNKEIYQGGKATIESGQILARRLHGILYSIQKKGDHWKINQKNFKIFMESNTQFNDEHYLVNRYGTVSFAYGKQMKTISYTLPPNTYKKMSFICNYLIINSDINSELGNKPVSEKIRIIDKHINNKDKVFLNLFSRKLYNLSKEEFLNIDSSVVEQIKEIEDENIVMEKLKEYYTTVFLDHFNAYVKKIYELALDEVVGKDIKEL